MKTILSIIFALTIVATVAAKEPGRTSGEKARSGIEFHEGTWEEALDLAKESGKLLFLNISASWCGPCKALKRNTFPYEEVGTYYNANFINVLVDGEKGEGIDLAKKFRIKGYPSMIFLDSDGELIAQTSGYRDPEDFIELGQVVLNK